MKSLILILNFIVFAHAGFYKDVPDLSERPVFYDPTASQKNYELTTLIKGRGKECFYQFLSRGNTMELSYKVISGPSRSNAIEIRGPNKEKIFMENFPIKGEMAPKPVTQSGYYEICISCRGLLGENKVNFDFSFYSSWKVLHEEKKLNETLETTDNLQGMVGNMRFRAMLMARHYRFRKLLEGSDEIELEMNLKYVKNISILVSCIIIAVAFLQTYALKWMFRDVGQTKV